MSRFARWRELPDGSLSREEVCELLDELEPLAALADELARWGAQLAHLAVGLKTGRDLDHVIGEWEKAVAKWEASRG